MIELTGYIDVDKAQCLEEEWLNTFKEFGFIALNKIKTGGLGGSTRKWTRDELTKEAAKYNERGKFQKESNSAYGAAHKIGILDEICSHMTRYGNMKPIGHWTFENVNHEANKYRTRTEFARGTSGAYSAAQNHGWLDLVCGHMERAQMPFKKLDKGRVLDAAKNYFTRSAFKKGTPLAYAAAQKDKVLDEVCAHMTRIKQKNGYWDRDNCAKEAQKYKTKSEFNTYSNGAYEAVRKKSFLESICAHMITPSRTRKWTKENCHKAALGFGSKMEFKKGASGAYSAATQNKWISDICTHMGS